MTDIIARLRSRSPYLDGSSAERIMDEAAAEIERLTEEVAALRLVATAHNTEMLRLEAALRWGIGAALNELTARNIPLEWSPNGGIGKMLAALGVNATTMTDEVLAALEPEPEP